MSGPWSRITNIIKNFIDQEYEFGIEADAVQILTGLSATESKALTTSLSKNSSGVYVKLRSCKNILQYMIICVLRLLHRSVNSISLVMVLVVLADCSQRLETQRLDSLFDLMDFNHSGKLSFDELTVLFVCLANAVSAILGSLEVPSEEIITVMTLNIFDKMKRASNGSITRAEFKQWCSATLESLNGSDFDVIYQTFCTGGPVVEEEEPEDGIPKLMSATEDKSLKKINKAAVKKPVFVPSKGRKFYAIIAH